MVKVELYEAKTLKGKNEPRDEQLDGLNLHLFSRPCRAFQSSNFPASTPHYCYLGEWVVEGTFELKVMPIVISNLV